jgi:CRP-like cAMP-binding protein
LPDVSSPILSSLTATDRARLLDRAVPRRLRASESLHLAGDSPRRAHLLLRGVVKLVARNAEGQETILCLAVPGELVGDVAAADGFEQPLDAVAATPSDLLGLDAGVLVEVLSSNAGAALELSRLIAQRTRWVCEAALERTSSEVPARLAGRLLHLADLLGRREQGAVELELPLAQGDLGRLAGMCRESACKTLRAFKAAGILDYRGRRLRILRPSALEAIRCGERVEATLGRCQSVKDAMAQPK